MSQTTKTKPVHRKVLDDARQIELATRMIRCGARLQVLEAETSLSYDRLSHLYHEIRGCSPSKGLLPFSESWYLSWRANLHASLFYSLFVAIEKARPNLPEVECLIRAYQLYEGNEIACEGGERKEPYLTFTRAWMLVRFVRRADALKLSHCQDCGIGFLTHTHTHGLTLRCAVCNPPPRALPALRGGSIDTPHDLSLHHAAA